MTWNFHEFTDGPSYLYLTYDLLIGEWVAFSIGLYNIYPHIIILLILFIVNIYFFLLYIIHVSITFFFLMWNYRAEHPYQQN